MVLHKDQAVFEDIEPIVQKTNNNKAWSKILLRYTQD
jgi:hypothetical protein